MRDFVCLRIPKKQEVFPSLTPWPIILHGRTPRNNEGIKYLCQQGTIRYIVSNNEGPIRFWVVSIASFFFFYSCRLLWLARKTSIPRTFKSYTKNYGLQYTERIRITLTWISNFCSRMLHNFPRSVLYQKRSETLSSWSNSGTYRKYNFLINKSL